MRIIVRFAVREPLRYISHLDLLRAMQRCLRRSRVPVSFSQGFHPHPLVSFASALAVGMTSEAEYMDLSLDEAWLPERLLAALNAAAPPGLAFLSARPASDRMASLMSLVCAAEYTMPIPVSQMPAWEEGLARALEEKQLFAEIKGKKSVNVVDIRPMVAHAYIEEGVLRMLLAAGSRAHLRPEYALAAIGGTATEWAICRTALFFTHEGGQTEPMAYIEMMVEQP